VEFRILGLLEVVEHGQPLEVGRGKDSALLALLLLNANRPVSVERAVDELWEGLKPPANASKTVQIYVSRLRSRLGSERILTTPAGYVLKADASEVDASRFERLAAEGQAHLEAGKLDRAVGELTAALDLWRGEALADFGFDVFAQAEIGRLRERHESAVADQIDARLGLGQAAELITELEALVREHPLWERPRRQLMLALYHAGRQADALEAYQEARSTFVEGLGIEPSRALRELHQQILNQDPALEPEPRAAEGATPEETSASPAADAAGGLVPRNARKTVTVLFLGFEVSSPVGGQLDPEILRRIEGRILGRGQAAVERHGGSIDTASGAALTAVFGLPTVHEDDALRAVRAATEAREAFAGLAAELDAELGIALEWRIGISTGEVIVSGGEATQSRVSGAALSSSSLIAAAGQLICDRTTYRHVRDRVAAHETGEVWRITGLLDAPRGDGSRLTSPMVGRERERRRLLDAFEQAVGDRSCQLFTVLGVAGVGKSRLVQEALGSLSGRALIARGRCLPYGEGITFWPLAEAVAELAGVDHGASTDEALTKLTSALGEGDGAQSAARQVGELIGLVEATGRIEERFAAVAELLGSLARSGPVVVVFDDIHWGEPTFLDLVERLTDSVRGVALLIVCLARPELLELRAGWGGGKLNATTTLLEPLSADECTVLIRNLVGVTRGIESRIVEAAEGNPLFVEEMLSVLIDDGLLVRDKNRWRTTGDIAAVPVPATIHAVLAARLDQLDHVERAVIERAAVDGKVFVEGAIADLLPQELREAVHPALGSLVRKDLIRAE